MATALEADKVEVTPDIRNESIISTDMIEGDKLKGKNESTSADSQPTIELANSETLSNCNVENSNSQPLDNDISNPERKLDALPASETHVTSGDVSELDEIEESPMNELENSESNPNSQLGTAGGPRSTLADDSEAIVDNKLGNSEEVPSDDQLVGSEAPLDKKPASEAPTDNLAINPEMVPDNAVVNSETHIGNNVVVSEEKCSNEVVVSEAQCSNEVVISEAQCSNEVVVSEAQCSNEVVVSEAQCSNEVVVSETQHGDEEMVVCETQHNSELVISKAQCSNEVVISEAQCSNEVVVSEAQCINEVVVSETQHSHEEMVVCETEHSNEEMVVCETQHNNELVVSETHYNDETILSETQQNNKVVMSEMQPSGEVVMSNIQPSGEVPLSDMHPSSEVAFSDTQPSNETIMHEAQTSKDVVMSEGLPENELANSTIDHDNQPSHPEILSDNHQFTNLHIIPEDQLPQPESLPNYESPTSSEQLAGSHMKDIKPVLPNHMLDYDALSNNHPEYSEAMANHQLANSEMLSHDQLSDSQMFTHYELENSETLHNNSQSHYEIVNASTLPSYEIVNAQTPLDSEEHTPETQPNKRRKKKSIVWEHFTIETVSAGCRRACCKQCKQSFAYSTGSKVAGTSHLKRHIAKGACATLLRSQDPNRSTPYTPRLMGSAVSNASNTPKRRYRSPNTPYILFDQDRCRHEIARMIIMHDYPLHMVEHPGFVAFVQNMQPQFNTVTFNTIQGDCVAMYLMEKQNLIRYFEGLPGRVCLTLDTWTSSQSVGYVFITGHFVDNDWKLQRRILNVVMEPYPDSDSAISHAVAVCLSDWNLESSVFSITCNQALTEVAIENLRPLLCVKNPLVLSGQLLIRNCLARTVSDVANDLLRSAQDIVNKIRESVKYVKTSESHEETFLELKKQLQVPSERSLFIDDQTKWNTTYQMLVTASELQEVFSCLDTSDPDYRGALSIHDWKLVETLCTYLKPLFDAVNILTTTTHPTAITSFHEVWKLQLDLARSITNEDPFISNLTKPVQEKIDKYWRECSLVLAAAVVMDPRFKMKLVEFSFTKIYGEDAHTYIKTVDDGIHELFHEYVALPLPLTPAYAEEGSAGSRTRVEGSQGGALLADNRLADFDVYIMETTSHQNKSELDQYLEESLLPRVPDFDVLGWWKLNKLKYPTLSKMARDILSVSVSSVPSDSVFDNKSKEMDQYRCSLRPETVEAIVCTKDWMQYGADEASNALVKMGF